MHTHNLTEKQKNLLRWLVQEVRAGRLDEEEIWIHWTLDGTSIVGYEGNVPEIKKITLDAIQGGGFLVCDRSRDNQYKCALTSRTYEMADSNFASNNDINIPAQSVEEVTLAYSSQNITLQEAVSRFEVSPIIERFNTWAVTIYGVECLSYTINSK